MNLKVWCQTDVGLRRERNEDSFLFDEEAGIFLVADGLGGHRGGEVASKMATEMVRDFIKKGLKEGGSRHVNPKVLMTLAYERASEKIFEASQAAGSELHGMGTTLVSALRIGETLFIGNVGDSRAYLFSSGKLWQLTEDHSLLNEQLRAGLITQQEFEKSTSRNVITRCVGFERDVQVDVIERQLEPGDMILMCSDGLSGLVRDERIAEICGAFKPQEIVSVCVEEAKANGGLDNVTVMVIYAEPRAN